MSFLAVDIGGTKLATGIVAADGSLVDRRTTPTEGRDGDELFARLLELVDGIDSSAATACGIACGGPMSRGGELVSPLNIPQWREFPVRDQLARHTGLPTYLDNDAKAMTLGEGWCGAASGVDNYLGMVVSTGVGGGIVLDGRLLDGASGNAGHIGHVIVVDRGQKCGCGARGCLEAEASGTAIARATGQPAEHASQEVRVRTGTLVGRAVASVANLLDLQLAVVAGSVALGFGAVFFDAAQAEIDSSCRIEHARGTVVRPAGLGDQAPLVGAAAVARRATR